MTIVDRYLDTILMQQVYIRPLYLINQLWWQNKILGYFGRIKLKK